MADIPVEIQIEQAKTKIAEQVDKLDSLASSWVKEAKTCLPSFFRDWISRIVESKADRIAQLGREKIVQAKAELNTFIGHLAELIDKAMPRPADWWHHRQLPKDPFSPKDYPDALSELRQVLGPFGMILIKYGLGQVSGAGEWEGTADAPKYRLAVLWPEPLSQAQEKYAVNYRALIAAAQSLQTLEKWKKEKDAKALWDQA